MDASVSFGADSEAATYVLGVSESEEIGGRIKQIREARGPLSQQQFADRLAHVTRGAVGNWERGKGIKRENLQTIATTFRVSYEWLATGRGGMELSASNLHEPVNAFVGDRLPPGVTTIPLYGHAVGGQDGEFVLNGNKLDDITAPPSLSSVHNAYAVTVAGESMEPRYFDGETVFVDPNKRVSRGDFVVAQVQYEESGPRLAYIKRFVRHNADELVLEQYNPPKELRFPHANVVSVDFIVMGGRAT